MKKILLGLVEEVDVVGPRSSRTVKARIDTGAKRNSIDAELARKLHLEIVSEAVVKQAHGKTTRGVITAGLVLKGRRMMTEFTVADRAHMKFKVLIGRNVLSEGFLIDPSLDGE